MRGNDELISRTIIENLECMPARMSARDRFREEEEEEEEEEVTFPPLHPNSVLSVFSVVNMQK
jgi:hypothetical protein